MFDSLETLWGASVIATDGKIGSLDDFLFDDRSWAVRYIVVNVGSWLSHHDVLVDAAALGLPDWKRKVFTVNLSQEQVRQSPDASTKRPVSRQQQAAMNEFYELPRHWRTGANPEMFMGTPAAGREFPVPADEDPHLRSAGAVCGYEVRDDGERIGTLEDYFADEHSWHIGYLDVKAGDWLHGRSLMIPTRWVKGISWGRHRVSLQHSHQPL